MGIQDKVINMKFSSKMYLPILNEEVRYSHLNNNNFLTIIKYAINNDEEGLMSYFEWLINDTLEDKSTLSKLTNVEKFIILLDLRSVLLGDKLQLSTPNGNKIDLLVSSIKNNIINKLKEIELTKVVKYNNIILKLGLPKTFNINNIDDLYYEIIDKIQIGDDIINFSDLNKFEKDGLISNIPANMTEEMINFINLCQGISKKVNIITANERLGLDNIPLRVFDTSLFQFIKSLFGDELLNFYEMQYNMLTKVQISNEHFMSISPNECKILMNLYNEDMKRQEQAQKSDMPSMPSMPSMPNMPKMG